MPLAFRRRGSFNRSPLEVGATVEALASEACDLWLGAGRMRRGRVGLGRRRRRELGLGQLERRDRSVERMEQMGCRGGRLVVVVLVLFRLGRG